MTGVARLAWAVISAASSTGGVVALARAWRWSDPPAEQRPANPEHHAAAASGLFAIPPEED